MIPAGYLTTSRVTAGSGSSPEFLPFQEPVRVPPTAQPAYTRTITMPDGQQRSAAVYKLNVAVGYEQVLPRAQFGPTRIWGYNGQYPGPTFVVDRDNPVVIELANFLHRDVSEAEAKDLDLANHLHGGNQDGISDGHPLNAIRPGSTKVFTYFGDQPAATMWYHDHGMHHTGRNVYMGIAGFYLFHDAHERSLGLPTGPDAFGIPLDLPLVLQDRIFSSDGSRLIYPPGDHPEDGGDGVLGDTMLVNGVGWPYVDVQRRRYRIRFLNGSNAREYALRLRTDSGANLNFILIGTESGMRHNPLRLKELQITPAERYDVVIDFGDPLLQGASTVVLENTAESKEMRQIMQFRLRAGSVADSSNPLPDTEALMATDLATRFEELLAAEASVPNDPRLRPTFTFDRSGGSGFRINGQFYEQCRDDLMPREGDVQVITMVNNSGGWFHPVHLHMLHAGYGFVILDRNGRRIEPGSQEWGWKETVNLGYNNDSLRVITRWPKVPINPDNRNLLTEVDDLWKERCSSDGPVIDPVDFFERRFVFHCHALEHEDYDMMAQIRVDPAT